MMLVFAWLSYLALFLLLTVNWLIVTPILGVTFDAMNSTMNSTTGFSQDGVASMSNLVTMFSYSYSWVIMLGAGFLILFFITYMARRDEGAYSSGVAYS